MFVSSPSALFFWLSQRLKKVVSIDSYVDVTPHDENALMCAVAQQPVSVAINAGGYDFQLYAGVSSIYHQLVPLLVVLDIVCNETNPAIKPRTNLIC